MSMDIHNARSFVERMEMQDGFALELVTGHDERGEPCHSVLLLPVSRVGDLRRALAIRDVMLDDYGEVLAKGEGHEPPEGLIEELLGLITAK